MGRKLYLNKTVDVALDERMRRIFDTFDTVVVSISGGKDSTVLFEAARLEALRRDRDIVGFFLDQEAEYGATIKHVREQLHRPGVKPAWFQVPIRMTNATSYEADMLHAWEPGADWIRHKEPDSIHEAPGAPDRFYEFFPWFERSFDDKTCFLVGLRAEEALNRYRAVTKHPGIDDVMWSSMGKREGLKLYPLYDFTFEDIWTYIGRNELPYNKVYDWMWAKGAGIQTLRVSNLIHEMAFKSLAMLQEFEHDTFEALQRRLPGVHAAAIYAKEQSMYDATVKPKAYATWRAYRDFLLETLPLTSEHKRIFDNRFAGQQQLEGVYRQQCRQLLINDWENNVPVAKISEDRADPLKKWMEIL